MRPMPFLLFPAVALVAQAPTPAPANLDLAQRFNNELPGITQMLKELKTQEALAKVQPLIPAERPAFDATSFPAIGKSLDNAQGLMSLYRLYANVVSEAGLWEKALEIQERRAKDARAIMADLEKAQTPISEQWKKVAKDSGEYVAANEPKKKELEDKIHAFDTEYQSIVADVKAGKRKLTKAEADDIQARGAKIDQDKQELANITAALPVHKQNAANAPKVATMLSNNHKEVEGMITAADEAVAKAKKSVMGQNDEITQFNTQQVLKKVKIVGKKTWVDAVLRVHENITKLGGPQSQAAFLNRLLVLDPGNPNAQKALDNLKAGKDAFAKEPKSGKKGAAKKNK